MAQTIQTITEKLHAEADKNLNRLINRLTLDGSGADGIYPHQVQIEIGNAKYRADYLLNDIRKALFDLHQAEWREGEVNRFLSDVQDLKDQLNRIGEHE